MLKSCAALALEAADRLFLPCAWLHQRRQSVLERLRRTRKRHTVLRTLGASDAGFDGAEVELDHFGVSGFLRIFAVKQSLLFAIGLDQRDLLGRAPSHPQIAKRFVIYWKDAAGGTVLGGHVGDG